MPAITLFSRSVYLLFASATLFWASMAAQESLDRVTTSSSVSVMAFMAVEPESSNPPTSGDSMVLQPASTTPLTDDDVVTLSNDRSEEHTSELQSHSDLVCR